LTALELPAVALTKENVKEDPEIWAKLERAEYRLVYASPEILLNSKSPFKKIMTGENKFRDHLAAIAMDEAHSVWSNGEFRKEYNKIGAIRAYFPKVPWVALSATFPPHLMSFCQKVCNMTIPSDVVTCAGRRTNINIIVIEKPAGKTIRPLLDLIPDDLEHTGLIPKTLIFVDSCKSARRLAQRMRKRLRQILPSFNSENAIRTYYSTIDNRKKQETYNLLKISEARLVFCTDSMSLGVNIPDVARVIQWGVTKKVDMNSLVQRIGRAARNQEIQGLAVVYAPKSLLRPVPKHSAAEWTTNPPPVTFDDPDGELWEDEDDPAPVKHRDLACFSLPVTQDLQEKVDQFQRHMYRKAKASKDGVVNTVGPRKATDTIDPALLWFLNTVGCRHRCILSYLKYPDVFDDSNQKSWCCDNCAFGKNLDPQTTNTEGFSVQSSYAFASGSTLPSSKVGPARPDNPRRPITATTSSLLHEDVKAWRKGLFDKLVSRRVISRALNEVIVLPDDLIAKVVTAFPRIHHPSDLADTLQSAKFDIKCSLLREKDVVDLFGILQWRVERESRPAALPHPPPSNGTAQTTQASVLPLPVSDHSPTISDTQSATALIQQSLPRSTIRERKRRAEQIEGGKKKRRQPLAEVRASSQRNNQYPERPNSSVCKVTPVSRRQADGGKSVNKLAGKTITSLPTSEIHSSCSLSGGSQRHLRYAGCDIAKVSNELRSKEGKRIIKASQKLIDGKGD